MKYELKLWVWVEGMWRQLAVNQGLRDSDVHHFINDITAISVILGDVGLFRVDVIQLNE